MSGSDAFWDAEPVIEARRGYRAEARAEFLRVVERSLGDTRPARERQTLRPLVAGALTVALAVGLAATGGISYAASSLRSATHIADRHAAARRAIVGRGLTAGGDQYVPGYGFGDPNHNHDGPPGIVAKGAADGEAAPPTAPDAAAKNFAAAVSFDEQVHLYISVIDPNNTPLLLTQHSKRGGSKVGDGLSGPQTKFIQYAVLVPRPLEIKLRVPANLLAPNVRYRMRIVAIDPQGNRSQLLIPFRP